jgi:hypothetical protein
MAKRTFAKIFHELRTHLHELSGSQLKVWVCHRLHEGPEGTSYPSVSLIAKETGLDPDTVKNSRRYMRENGWLRTISHKDSVSGKFAVPVEQCTYPWLTDRGVNTPSDAGVETHRDRGVKTASGFSPSEVDTSEEAPRPSDASPSEPDGAINSEERESKSKNELEREEGLAPLTPILTLGASFDQEKQAVRDWAFMEASREPISLPDDRPNWSARLGRVLDCGEWHEAECLYADLMPKATEFRLSEILALAEVALDLQIRYGTATGCCDLSDSAEPNPVRDFWRWNQVHKQGRFLFYSMAIMANSYWSDNERSSRAQWEMHDGDSCRICRLSRASA